MAARTDSPVARNSDHAEHQRFASSSVSDPAETLAFAIETARTAHDDKCENVLLLDVRKVSQVSDYMVICSGTSDRQMHSVADDIDKLAAKSGYPVFRRNTDDATTWVLVDCVDVVVHVFEPNTRAHYDLEMLWADAPRVAWEREAKAAKPKVAKPKVAKPKAAKPKAEKPKAAKPKSSKAAKAE